MRAVRAFTACSGFSFLYKIKYNPEPSITTIQAIKIKTIHSNIYITTLLVIGGITLLCSLGFWQLSRAQQKQQILASHAHMAKHSPLSATEVMSSQPKRFAPVAFKATFDNDHIVLLDNQTNNGQAGYQVFIPAFLNDQTLILVERGWVPVGASRALLPSINPVIGEVTIEGYLDNAYRNPFILKSHENLQWPLRMQQLDLALLSQYLQKNIYPMLVTKTPKTTGMTPARHQGYALQWFSLAITLLCCYLYFLHKRASL